MVSSRTPVLLLTGFLGSGKTTLLNRLMRAKPHETSGKLAIVVNEFGDVGIDGELLPPSMTRQVELPGGCICCVLNEELDTTLIELLDAGQDIEFILIETTGIAEPLPISWSLARQPLSDRVRLAAVITVVDALNFAHHRPLAPSVDAQVEYADILVLSKMDLLPESGEHLEGRIPPELRDVLQALNPTALRVSGSADQVVHTLWQSIADPELPAGHRTALAPEPAPDPGHHEGDHSHEGGHSLRHELETAWIPIENTLDFEELEERLEELPANYVRIKGIARVIDESTGSSEPRWVAFHRVGTRVSSEPVANPTDSRLVALGTRLERALLSACVQAAVVRSDG